MNNNIAKVFEKTLVRKEKNNRNKKTRLPQIKSKIETHLD